MSLTRQAVRIHVYILEGIQLFHARSVVENSSLLMHAAVFLFFVGLVEFIYPINHEVAMLSL